MDQSPRPSGIPRISRLPVARTSVKTGPSIEDLHSSRLGGLHNPRLRNIPSRDHLTNVPTREHSIPLRNQKSSHNLSERSAAQKLSRQVSDTTLNNGVSRTLRPKRSIMSIQSTAPVGGTPNIQDGFTRSQGMVDGQVLERNMLGESNNSLGTPRKPSLSERAIDTLQNTPSARRRRSSFFNPESPMVPSSSGTFSSRPGSSDDYQVQPPSQTAFQTNVTPDFRASTNSYKPSSSSSTTKSLLRKPSAPALRTPSSVQTYAAKNILPGLPSPDQRIYRARSPSPGGPTKQPVIKAGSRTLAARPLKSRPSMNRLFDPPESQTFDAASGMDGIGTIAKTRAPLSSRISQAKSYQARDIHTKSPSNNDELQETTPRKSSMALREQIAKAKAAKRAVASSNQVNKDPEVPVIPDDTFDFGLSSDPFGQQQLGADSKVLLKKRIRTARLDGRLNISALGLKQIPDEVMTMYDLETNDGSWAECVDLVRFVAAGNEIASIPEHIFPDVDPQSYIDDDDAVGNQFGALETIDLHANLLTFLPLGLRRLEHLTALNMADNKLDGHCFHVISQIRSLRDLKLSNNELSGPLTAQIASLENLESLELQQNGLTSIPEELASLSRLRILNLTDNRLSEVPFNIVQQLPLSELLLAKNKLTGTLIESGVESIPHLRVLDITGNSVEQLTSVQNLSLPALHQLCLSYNRVTTLPDISTWTSLRTLIAEDNCIENIPHGFSTLGALRNVDFRGNNIRNLDVQIGNMESLDNFRITGNPLKEKKFAGMTTEDLKRALKARIETDESVEQDREISYSGSYLSAPTSPLPPIRPHSSDWLVGHGGILDRSNHNTSSLNPVAAANVAANYQITALELHHNVLKEVPSSIEFFAATLTTLNISHNVLNSDTFFNEELVLPALKELNLSCNTIDSLQPLICRLQAPNLTKLDVSFNRLTSLPPLKPYFPSLVTLFASNNTIRELSPEAVKGLTTLDCSSNEINSLNPRIGLLGGAGGLQRLDVSGNRFRVPKYTILEKGTEATLAWLRDRVPAGELSPTQDAADID